MTRSMNLLLIGCVASLINPTSTNAALVLFPGTAQAITDGGQGDADNVVNNIIALGANTPTPNNDIVINPFGAAFASLTGFRFNNNVAWILTDAEIRNTSGVLQAGLQNQRLATFTYGANVLAGKGALTSVLQGSYLSPQPGNGVDYIELVSSANTFSNNSPTADVGPIAVNEPANNLIVFNSQDTNSGIWSGAGGELRGDLTLELAPGAAWRLPNSIEVFAVSVPEPSGFIAIAATLLSVARRRSRSG